MRDPVEIIHRAIQRIDNPLMLARLVANGSFFAVESVLGKFLQERLSDELLRLDIDGELDVVRQRGVDVLRTIKIVAQQLSRFARSVLGRVEIMLHEEVEWVRS